MILEDNQLLYSLLQGKLLQIATNNHRRTWDYYYEQYHKAVCVLINNARQTRYQTNRIFRPFLFLMWHSLELFLKNKIALQNKKIPPSHKIEELYNEAGISDEEFLKAFTCLQCETDGSHWRYLTSNTGEQIKAFDACDYYLRLLDNNNSLANEKTNKKLLWELTFHPTESATLGHIGTQYDSAIRDILVAIKNDKVSINNIYLPLLFLLRHCLEIKLKSAILDLGNVVDEKNRSKVCSIHSVKDLYDILDNHIDGAIKSITNPELKKQSEDLRHVTEQYKDIIAKLDANSFLFRFPTDKNGRTSNFLPKPDYVSKILKLYWESDSFLCFSVPVLYEAGVLNIGDDKVREYYQ